MHILSFESSCDETAAAVLSAEDGRLSVLSDIVASQVDIHRLYGGVVPEIAGRAHLEAISSITYEALETAGVTLADIDLIAVTAQPGLIGALLVAVNFAKSLAYANGIPLVPVDHIKGHIAAVYLTETPPVPPYIALALSGGHTAVYLVESYTDFHLLGTTRDDAIGESFDKIGRMIGLPYPAGAGFDKLATEGFIRATGRETDFYRYYKKSDTCRNPDMVLPSPALSDGSLDFSFSGLKTAAINLMHRCEQKGCPVDRAALAAKYTYEATEAVAKKADAALRAHPGHALTVAGGVAANTHLRRRLAEVAAQNHISLCIPPIRLCGDNAAMIGAQGYYEYLAGHTAGTDLNASAADSVVS